jgi:hypothetical protein
MTWRSPSLSLLLSLSLPLLTPPTLGRRRAASRPPVGAYGDDCTAAPVRSVTATCTNLPRGTVRLPESSAGKGNTSAKSTVDCPKGTWSVL